MYIEPTQRYYTRDGQQAIKSARFLILCEPKGVPLKDLGRGRKYPPRALIRKVALKQMGHFMVGYARAFGHTIYCSGSYGADGLIRDVPMEVYEKATPVPEELLEAWSKGGGWNSCGSEAPAMAEWANSLKG